MDSRPDIWHQLRDHQTPPSPEALLRLRESLSGLSGTFERLQREEITPPAQLRRAITNAITGRSPGRKRYIYGSIAASFLFLIIGYTIYKTLQPGSRRQNNPIVQNSVLSAPATPTAGDTQNLGSGSTLPSARTVSSTQAGDSARITINPSVATLSSTDSISVKLHRNWTISLDGHNIHLVNNDPLYTFTSYHYPGFADHMEQKEGEDIKISVDKYTNIIVSKQAAVLLREIYKTRSNGKPTRRARKTKERLEYWKKTDEKRFDSTPSQNPADPIDLAEFIFK